VLPAAGRALRLVAVRQARRLLRACREQSHRGCAVTANRGLNQGCEGRIIARNYSAYTLEINPRQVDNVAAVIDDLAQVIEVQPRDRRRFKKLQRS